MKLIIYSPSACQAMGHNFDYVSGLGSALMREGVDVHVLSLEGPRRLPASLSTHMLPEPVSGGRPARLARAKRGGVVADVRWGVRRLIDQNRLFAHLLEVAERLRADHILFETFEYVALARHLGRLPAPYSVIVHDTNFNTRHRSGVAAAYKTLVRSMVRRIVEASRAAFVHGAGMQDNLTRILRLERPPALLPYGAPVPPAEMMTHGAARRELGIETNGPLLLSFGTLRDDKNFPLLLDALALAPAWSLLVAGPEGNVTYGALRHDATRAGVAGRLVERPGYVGTEAQEAYFRAADAVTALYDPSIRHESGTAQLARTFLTPVVASGPDDLRRYVEDEGVGWFVPDASPRALADVLARVARRDAAEQLAMEERIRTCALRRSWPAVARLYLQQIQ